jgi:type I restriction enzyme M protein
MPTDDSLDFYADKFNELFRDASVKDDKRPAVVGALMLALWWVQTEGEKAVSAGKPPPAIRRADALIIGDAADFCVQAFKNAGSRQAAMGEVLSNTLKSMVSADSTTGTQKSIKAVRTILHDLEKLGVGKTQLSTDFLGQLYERFFQFTGALCWQR